jgi:hypothetical protein
MENMESLQNINTEDANAAEITEDIAIPEDVNTSEGKQIFKVSASSLDSIDRCGLHYKFSKVQRYRPTPIKRALDWGGLMHLMIQGYRFSKIKDIKEHHLNHPFARLLGRPVFEVMRIVAEIGRIQSLVTDLSPEDRESCIEKFMEYVSYWNSRDKFQVLEVEQPFSKVLYENENLIILYEGIMDMLVHDEDWGPVPYDTKTGGWNRPRFDTENQLTGTCWVFNSNKFVIDKVLEVKEEPFRREIHSYRQEQLEEWRIDAIQTSLKAINYIKNDFFPRHRNGCSMYGGCEFYRVCKTTPDSRDFQLEAFFKRDASEFHLYRRDEKLREMVGFVMGPVVTEE